MNNDFVIKHCAVFSVRGREFPHITQIAAIEKETGQHFSRYVTPGKPIHMEVTNLTGIAWDGYKLTVHGKEVQAVPISQALLEFFKWLQQFHNTVLVAHNGKRFDFRILSKAVQSCDLFDSFEQRVVGFVDSVHVLKEKTSPVR